MWTSPIALPFLFHGYYIPSDRIIPCSIFKHSSRKVESLSLNLEIIKNVKAMTDLVDFGCEFNESENGICRKYIAAIWPALYKEKCCCSYCRTNLGYLTEKDSMVLENDLPTYEKAFDTLTGFWRPNGCILHRSLRSTTCVFFTCFTGEEERNRAIKRVALRKIRQAVCKLERENRSLIYDIYMSKGESHAKSKTTETN